MYQVVFLEVKLADVIFCWLLTGTQTIGSVSRPAAYCGVVGFKPSKGRVSIKGIIPVSLLPTFSALVLSGSNFVQLESSSSYTLGLLKARLRIAAPGYNSSSGLLLLLGEDLESPSQSATSRSCVRHNHTVLPHQRGRGLLESNIESIAPRQTIPSGSAAPPSTRSASSAATWRLSGRCVRQQWRTGSPRSDRNGRRPVPPGAPKRSPLRTPEEP